MTVMRHHCQGISLLQGCGSVGCSSLPFLAQFRLFRRSQLSFWCSDTHTLLSASAYGGFWPLQVVPPLQVEPVGSSHRLCMYYCTLPVCVWCRMVLPRAFICRARAMRLAPLSQVWQFFFLGYSVFLWGVLYARPQRGKADHASIVCSGGL
jgi:hypothetical protein